MYEPKSKKEGSHHRSVAEAVTQRHKADLPSVGIPDQRREAAVQRKLMALTRPEPLQKKENDTGLPDKLKSGVEQLSGLAMDDVKVHYNSAKPATVQAHAYAQGTDIHLAPGQERHLPHEAWHVVQQKQGRVRPTMQLRGKVNVNDDASLEREADVMGAKALRTRQDAAAEPQRKPAPGSATQRMAVIQREDDPVVREETDRKIDALAGRVITIMERIKGMPIHEKSREEQGAAKGEEMVERSDEVMYALTHPVETVKQAAIDQAKKAAKNYWKGLSPQERLSICARAGSAGLRVVGEVVSSATTGTSGSGGSSEQSAKAHAKESGGGFSLSRLLGGKSSSSTSSQENSRFHSALESLNAQDLKTLYGIMKETNGARKEWKEANAQVNAKIKGAAGKVGGFVGKMLGSAEDSIAKTRLASEITPQLPSLREALEEIRGQATGNSDFDRYQKEYDTLNYALTNAINGPLSLLVADLNEEGIESAKKQAAIVIHNLGDHRTERQIKGGIDKVASTVNSAKERVGAFFSSVFNQ
ncbi:DUF4157 domain-containing protein [Lewinella sp. W8]|uniref:eCIS core domain-containing protein n=1 Tax=Lewinella sp. W8 TaxID=2528208 RepID=UPI0010678D60|nr:DUF4157 domain-containing protein [Lewinella sp. W8]MTB53122.1 DUF4157 domain-containing protein [Lewinella sp. W8]